jgi:hypothetical protein
MDRNAGWFKTWFFSTSVDSAPFRIRLYERSFEKIVIASGATQSS